MHTLASASTMHKTIAEEFNFSAGPTVVSYLVSVLCCVLHDVVIFLLPDVLGLVRELINFPFSD